MIRRATLSLLLAAALGAGSLGAQASPAPIKYGKWALLAGSVALNVAAADAHREAERTFDVLEARCTAEPALCNIAGGSYSNPETEALYQETLSLDRRSRRLLFAGEGALLGAAVLFVWEFSRPRGRPEDIPFEPEVSFRPGATNIGLRVAW